MSTNSDAELTAAMSAAESRVALGGFANKLFGQTHESPGKVHLNLTSEPSDAMAEFSKRLFKDAGQDHTFIDITPDATH